MSGSYVHMAPSLGLNANFDRKDIKIGLQDHKKAAIYFPPQVKPERLKSNGKLLDSAEIKKADSILHDKPVGRYPKGDIGPYGIIKEADGTLFAIYNEDCEVIVDGIAQRESHQVEIGSGGAGKVKFAQNLSTGEWYILKTVIGDNTSYEAFIVDEEVNTLYESKYTDQKSVLSRAAKYGFELMPEDPIKRQNMNYKNGILYLTRSSVLSEIICHFYASDRAMDYWYSVDTPELKELFQKPLNLTTLKPFLAKIREKALEDIDAKPLVKRNFLMKHSKGENLDALITSEKIKNLPFLLLLRMVVKILQAYRQDIFDNGFLHLDIKPGNIIVCLATLESKIIDLGFATKYITADKPVKRRYGGTPGFTAPDINKNDAEFSQKSEIYSFSETFSRLLFGPRMYDLLTSLHIRNVSDWRNNTPVVKFLEKMNKHYDSNRPDLNETLKFFEDYTNEYAKNHPEEVLRVEEIIKTENDAETARLLKFTAQTTIAIPEVKTNVVQPQEKVSLELLPIPANNHKKEEAKDSDATLVAKLISNEKIEAFQHFSQQLKTLVNHGVGPSLKLVNIKSTQSLSSYAKVSENTFLEKSKHRKAQAGFLCNILKECYIKVDAILEKNPDDFKEIQNQICHVYNMLGMKPLDAKEDERRDFDKAFGFDRDRSIKDKNSVRYRYDHYSKSILGQDELKCFIDALDQMQKKLAVSLGYIYKQEKELLQIPKYAQRL